MALIADTKRELQDPNNSLTDSSNAYGMGTTSDAKKVMCLATVDICYAFVFRR